MVWRHARIRHRPRPQHRPVEPAQFQAAGRCLRQPALLARRHHRARGGGFASRRHRRSHRARPGIRAAPRSHPPPHRLGKNPPVNAAAPGSRPPAHRLGLLLSLSALLVLAWGFNYVFGKLAIVGFRPASGQPAIAAIGARLILAAVVVLLLAAAGAGRGWVKPVRRRDLPRLLLLGFTGITLNQYFFVLGLDYTSVGHAALIFALTPVCVLLLAAALRQERITGLKVLGLLLCLAGVSILMRPAVGAGGSRKGDFIEFLAALSFAI